MEIQHDMVVRRDEGVIFADVASECVMLNIETGRYHSLSEVGARIWELLETPKSTRGLTEALVGEFDVDADTCGAAVIDFLEKLTERRLVHVVS